MMNEIFSRTELMIGSKAIQKLKTVNIAIFGVGGVGGYVCEGLARSGIYSFTLFDNDVVSPSNINRQIIATFDTLGEYKVIAMKKRILSINPNAIIDAYPLFITANNLDDYDFSKFDYVVDCVDNVTAKIAIIKKAKENNIKVISAMGAGNKSNPLLFEIKDINQTSVCPLARVMRYELKKRNIADVKVCFSKEIPFISPLVDDITKKSIPASNAFTPSVCGLLIAREIINDLIGENNND